MASCIFCAITNKQSPATIEYEDDEIMAFRDTNPKARIHLLIVPKKHIPAVTKLQEKDAPLVGKMILVAKKMAEKHQISEEGFRLCLNVGKGGGQIVDHLHLHLMGGQKIGSML